LGADQQTNTPIAGQNFIPPEDSGVIMEVDSQRWKAVKEKIETFVNTTDGLSRKRTIIEGLRQRLKDGELKQYHGDAPISEDMYKLSIAFQLAFHQHLRAKNNGGQSDQLLPTFKVSLVTEVRNSTAYRTKTIHFTMRDGQWLTIDYLRFCEELRKESQGPQAEQEGFLNGYSLKDGPWLYEKYDAKDSQTLEEFKSFDIETWKRMRGNIPYLIWHASIIRSFVAIPSKLTVAGPSVQNTPTRAGVNRPGLGAKSRHARPPS
jgi:hypothetical protein